MSSVNQTDISVCQANESESIFSSILLQQLLLPYEMNSTPKGYALIVNNVTFEGYEYLRRTGATYDTQRFADLFRTLGFTVYELEDLTTEELWHAMEMFQERFIDDPADCCIMCLMSHGTEGNYILTYDSKWINIRSDLLAKFNSKNCPQLKGKPKVFFFQCCRGDNTDLGVTICESETDSGTNEINYEEKIDKYQESLVLEDMLVCYATNDGYYAYRQPSEGTWYIQLLCSIFKEYADKLDICEMLNLLAGIMSTKAGDKGEKQICPFTNYGFSRKLYLR